MHKIYQCFQNNVWSTVSYNPVVAIPNLVSNRWLSDDVIDTVFDIINMKHNDTICFCV